MLKKILPILLLLLVVGSAGAVSPDPAGSAVEQPLGAAARIVELGSDTYRGVLATARLKIPHQQSLSGSGEVISCQLLVSFASAASGKALTVGDVAVKVGDAEGRLSAPVRLKPAEEGFRAMVMVGRGGESLLKIGSRLADNKKRIYRFYAHL